MSDTNVTSTAPVTSAAPETTNAPENTQSNTGGNGNVSAPSQENATSAPAGMGGKAPTPPTQPTPVQKEAIRRHKLKVDGREEEYDEAEVIKLAQLGRASNRRFQEAAQAKKQAEDFISMLKTNPRSVLENPAIGVDLRKFAETYLSEQLRNEQLSPEQRRIQELENSLKQHDEEKKSAAVKQQEEEFKQLTDKYAAEFEPAMISALQENGLPRTPYTVKRMTDLMSTAIANGIELEPKHVAKLVRQDYIADAATLFQQTDGDTLLAILGDKVANKIRKADLARLKNPFSPQAPAPEVVEGAPEASAPKSAPSQGNPGSKPMNVHEWRAMMDKKRN